MSKKAKTSRAKLIANPGSGDGSDRGPLLEESTISREEQPPFKGFA
jgi:hypothetical protein